MQKEAGMLGAIGRALFKWKTLGLGAGGGYLASNAMDRISAPTANNGERQYHNPLNPALQQKYVDIGMEEAGLVPKEKTTAPSSTKTPLAPIDGMSRNKRAILGLLLGGGGGYMASNLYGSATGKKDSERDLLAGATGGIAGGTAGYVTGKDAEASDMRTAMMGFSAGYTALTDTGKDA